MPGLLSAQMTRLPKRLQSEFSRDLHFATEQSPAGLTGRVTFGSDRFTEERILLLASDIVAFMEAAIENSSRPVSEIAPELGHHR